MIRQHRRWMVFLLAAIGGWLFERAGPGLAWHWLFGLAFGGVLVRSGVCFVAAVRDPVLTGGTTYTRAILAALALSTVGFTVVTLITGQTGTVRPFGWGTVIGGLIFGIGMVLAGGCVSGTIMRMGDGFAMQWVGFSGIFSGLMLGTRLSGSPWLNRSLGVGKVFLPSVLGWPVSLALQFVLLLGLWFLAVWHETRRFGLRRATDGQDGLAEDNGEDCAWPVLNRLDDWLRRPLGGALLLAGLNIGYFAVTGRPWGIITEMSYWASEAWRWLGHLPGGSAYLGDQAWQLQGPGLLTRPGTIFNIGILIGAFAISYASAQWRWRPMRHRRQIVAAWVGGLLVGLGSRLAVGCNIGNLFSGLPSLSLHSWLFLPSLVVGGVLGVRIASRLIFRPVLRLSSGRARK